MGWGFLHKLATELDSNKAKLKSCGGGLENPENAQNGFFSESPFSW
jgi:hypothetical protein